MTPRLDTLPPWHVACRADIPIAPDTIAGILDGDGCLALVPSGRARRWVPIVALSMRHDDPTPVAVARSLAAYIGRPVGYVRDYDRDFLWKAGALADVLAVIRFLERHPLLSPRGALQLVAIRGAADILRSARAGRGGAIPLTAAEHARLDALRAAIPARARVTASLPLPHAALAADDRRLGAYLAGFAAAEGCFQATGRGDHRARPVFSITQRIDNLALLEHVRDRLGIGRIGRMAVAIGSPKVGWIVEREADLDALIRTFREHPLPECSPKAGQFDAWAELVALRRGVVSSGARGDVKRSAAVAALASELRDAKVYRGVPASLCTCSPAEVAGAPA